MLQKLDNRAGSAQDGAEATQLLTSVVRKTLEDLRQDSAHREITLDSCLDRDLGLDSLARVELFARVEREFHVRLPESLFAAAETVRDIAVALASAAPELAAQAASVIEPGRSPEPSIAPPSHVATLDRLLAWRLERDPDFVQITLCEGSIDERISYAELWRRARSFAAGLQRHGVRSADVVALMLPTGAEYFSAFFGILLAGAIPAPLYPPTRLSQIEEHSRRHAAILQNCGAVALITAPELRRLAGVLRLHAPSLRRVLTGEELSAVQGEPATVALRPESIALLQYTSGSTGTPKGVVLTHANIFANIAALGMALQLTRDDLFVSWLPLYHDMGLIGAWLGTLYFGLPLVIMSPLSFLTHPVRWLQTIQRFGGTLSAAPNFAYELCLKRVTDDDLEKLDLSCWRVAMNGAEAVMPRTLERFQERFAPCGLRRSALTPVYGMAEASVGLTVPPMDRGPLIDVIERESFTAHGIAKPAAADAVNPLRFPSCGSPLHGHRIRIVDDAGLELPERREGRLEFSGPSATQGYFRNPQATQKLIHEGWLDSGDRAYIDQGEVYITGRVKDIIIRAGRHIYPEELEEAVASVPGVRRGCVAVFGSADVARGTERVIVLAETYATDPGERASLRQQIIRKFVALIGEPPGDVALAPPRTVLKTSSGKLRRAASRELYESGALRTASPRPAWRQLLSLVSTGVGRAIRRIGQRALDLLYGAWCWAVFALGAAAAWLITLPMRPAAVWAVAHYASRASLKLTGLTPRVVGREHLAATGPRIIVANHASYLDSVFLCAILRNPCRFVAKRELERLPLIGGSLRRLSAQFVERFEPRESVEAAHRLANIASSGPSLIFFPEGSFSRESGLGAFHLGAFSAAVTAAIPVLPIALQGTRTVLRDEQWLPHRAPVTIHIGAAIEPPPGEDAFAATVQLRDATREAISRHCGEPETA